eukprot:gene775-526_t
MGSGQSLASCCRQVPDSPTAKPSLARPSLQSQPTNILFALGEGRSVTIDWDGPGEKVFRAPDIIKKTRDLQDISNDEINFMLSGFENASVSEEQIGAWLLALRVHEEKYNDLLTEQQHAITFYLFQNLNILASPIINKKVNGEELSDDEIAFFVTGAVAILNDDRKGVSRAQLGAWLMAVFLKGMSTAETVSLTKHMLESGDKITWDGDDPRPVVDKHSTGGVGDTMTLSLAPCLAAFGLRAPLLAGRGLGHTGGTLDKLEAIKGYVTRLEVDVMKKIVHDIGCVVCGQTANITPADKILYATRDITSTVDHISLITASIISKKAAAGATYMVLDVKVGSAAFMTTLEDARELANSLIDVSAGLGIETDAVLTRMSEPIGKFVGNSLEVVGNLGTLFGRGPEDSVELTCTLGAQLLLATGKVESRQEGFKMMKEKLENGEALDNFMKMGLASGADQEVMAKLCNTNNKPIDALGQASSVTEILASESGFVQELKAMPIAHVCNALGAGRCRAEDEIDYSVGVDLLVKGGDCVEKGQVWCKVHHNKSSLSEEQTAELQSALVITKETVEKQSRIIEIISRTESRAMAQAA